MSSLADKAREAAEEAFRGAHVGDFSSIHDVSYALRKISNSGDQHHALAALRALRANASAAVSNAVAALLQHAEAELAERDAEIERLRSELDLAGFAVTTNEETIAALREQVEAVRRELRETCADLSQWESDARVLAHAYVNDSIPPAEVVIRSRAKGVE